MLNQIIRGALGERAGARTEVAWPAIDVISLMHSTYSVFHKCAYSYRFFRSIIAAIFCDTFRYTTIKHDNMHFLVQQE